ncbi:MAG: hypothetical protein H0V63_10300 [Burkholderiaceae bacterium]|nr:hypothetical protein [Burkholderiaceae bacterium]
MTPKQWAILALSCAFGLYAVIAITKAVRADWPFALMWFSYAMSNVALLWAEVRT